MSHSANCIFAHIIFSTRGRKRLITPSIQDDLHAYMATVIRNEGAASVYRVGGTADHVHIACRMPRMMGSGQLAGKVKAVSSRWMKKQGSEYAEFYWQEGYGAFSFTPEQLDGIIAYIEGQHEHHEEVGFKEEFRAFLDRYGYDYDDEYLWD